MRRYLTSIALLLTGNMLYSQTYTVGTKTLSYTDPARSNRAVGIEFHYPGTNATVASDSFPFVIFAHGFQMDQTPYYPYADSLAKRGYIVGLLTTETSLSPSHADFAQDLIFVYNKLIAESNTNSTSPFYHHVVAKGALGGHSMGGGATVLSCQYGNPATCYFTFAAATTNPSSITAAPNMTKPYLGFAGTRDCIAPIATNQQPMYDSSNSVCKTLINITDATHCQFGSGNFQCNFGEGFSGCAATPLARADQINKTLFFLLPFLDYYLKGNCSAWTLFESRYASDAVDVLQQSCSNSIPAIPQVSGNSAYCNGAATTLTALPSGFNYVWSNGGNSSTIQVSQVGTYSFTVSNGVCSLVSPPLNVSEAFPPVAPSAIISADTVCSGIANITLSVVNDTTVAHYNWLLPSGWTITQGDSTHEVTITSGGAGGAVSVSAENLCGLSPAVQKNISVIPSNLGTPGLIAGDTSVCEGTTVSYAIQPVSGANNYVWNLPAGWSGTPLNADSITALAASTGTLTVQAENECGQSVPTSLLVTVNTPPVLSGIIVGEDSVCLNNSLALNFALSDSTQADSFHWNLPVGWMFSGTDTAASVLVIAASSGVISVNAFNECGSSNLLVLNVAVLDTPVISLSQNGNDLTASGGADYEWFYNGQVLSAVSGAVYTPQQSGVYSVLGSNASGCSSLSPNFTFVYVGLREIEEQEIVIYPNPAKDFVEIHFNSPTQTTVEIFDNTGRLLLRKEATQQKELISLRGWSAGVYSLIVKTDGRQVHKKLVVQ